MEDDPVGRKGWIFWLLLLLLFVGGALWFSLAKGLMFLAALPLGLLFGFFLHKGDLCGASAFSEVLLMRDRRKVWGLWVAIATSMVVFAGLDRLGLVNLSPKPMLWLSYLVGGAIFGAGTVLAGGCVSGCLYKGAAGNINSIMALMGMPLGMAMVEYGPLSGLNKAMLGRVIKNGDGGSVSLPSLTGLPYWLLALLFAAATLAAALWMRKKRVNKTGPKIVQTEPLFRRFMTRPWRPWQAGLAIGLLAGPLYLSSVASGRNSPMCVTRGVLHGYVLLAESSAQGVLRAPSPKLWLIFVVLGLMLGSHVSARMQGTAKLLPKEPRQTLLALAGGVLVGMGAWFATGCVIGNILSGWALMSVGLVIFGAATILSNWAVTYFYLMGGWSRRAD